MDKEKVVQQTKKLVYSHKTEKSDQKKSSMNKLFTRLYNCQSGNILEFI